MEKSFGKKVMDFTRGLQPNWAVPEGVHILFPYDQVDTLNTMEAFYGKYYADSGPRIFLFGINPGRFGAGITGVPFTDPIRLEEVCGISTDFAKRAELSSIFVYEFIRAFGGAEAFYKQFYITSISPLGFTKNGKNWNYYDEKALQESVEPHIIDNINTQKLFVTSKKVAICMGQGKNYKYFQKINQQHHFFEKILPLPHPRWVMQYRRKRMEEFVQAYLNSFKQAIEISTE